MCGTLLASIERSKSPPMTVRRCPLANRPIVFLRPGHEGWGIPAVRSCEKHCFLYYSEALSLPGMALNDFYFFSLLERHRQCLLMCPSKAGTGKSPDLSDFTLAAVASLSQLLRDSRLDLRFARTTFKRNNLSHARGNVSLDNKEPE